MILHWLAGACVGIAAGAVCIWVGVRVIASLAQSEQESCTPEQTRQLEDRLRSARWER